MDQKLDGLQIDPINPSKNDPHYKTYLMAVGALIYVLFHFNDLINLIPKKEILRETIGVFGQVDIVRLGRGNIVTNDSRVPEQIYAVVNDTFYVQYLEEQPNYEAVRKAFLKRGVLEITKNIAIKDFDRETWQIVDGADTLVKVSEFRKYYSDRVNKRGTWVLGYLVIGIFILSYESIRIVRERSRRTP